MIRFYWAIALCFAVFLSSCNQDQGSKSTSVDLYSATKTTIQKNEAFGKSLPLSDTADFEQAEKGLIARDPNLVITTKEGKPVWNQPAYSFIEGKAPDTANPSLWRQARLNNIHGLFKVVDGIYQLRGFDLSNMTLIQGKTGWIVIDTLTSKETASRAFQFAQEHLGEKPVSAIIFTHNHVDHFGGATAILTRDEAIKNKIRIIAPKGFTEEAVSENVIAGIVMSRRSTYMYGTRLDRSASGHIGSGLGKEPALGSVSFLEPNETISKTPTELEIDGVRFVFQYVPESEAPAELAFYLPDHNAYCGGETVNQTMHNLYTPRGAKVRDALKWSDYINQAIDLFPETEVYFGTHHWPVWGKENVFTFLKQQRDTYKYIHDQTVRLASSGLTPKEIAEQIQLPESLAKTFSNRGYYGTLKHNAKAVYQFYFGWFDGNPANLDPLPPEEAATRYVKFMGGADKTMEQARTSFEEGDYRWVAEVLNHVVFADPKNKEAKELLALTYQQLGYQAESGPWRDIYLTGAHELIKDEATTALDIGATLELLQQTPIPNFLNSMATRLNGPKAEGKELKINLVFTDLNESYRLYLENAVLHHKKAEPDPEANATVKLTKAIYLKLAIGELGIKELVLSDDIEYLGSKIDLIRFFSLFDMQKGTFAIVVP